MKKLILLCLLFITTICEAQIFCSINYDEVKNCLEANGYDYLEKEANLEINGFTTRYKVLEYIDKEAGLIYAMNYNSNYKFENLAVIGNSNTLALEFQFEIFKKSESGSSGESYGNPYSICTYRKILDKRMKYTCYKNDNVVIATLL